MSGSPRQPLAVANWKMHKTAREGAAFAAELLSKRHELPEGVGLAVAPAFPALERVGRMLAPTDIQLAAQDVHVEEKGAFTGEVSAAMLRDLGVSICLAGHSERRRLRGEAEAELTAKLKRLVETGISPLYCVGETLEERERGETESVLAKQMVALDAFGSSPPPGLVVAYEPVWAIGTGRAATAAMAQQAHRELRTLLAARFGVESAAAIRILYGGSVTPKNATELFQEEDVDGALIGGASLVVADYAAIAVAAGGRVVS